jgi:hypothetical protein
MGVRRIGFLLVTVSLGIATILGVHQFLPSELRDKIGSLPTTILAVSAAMLAIVGLVLAGIGRVTTMTVAMSFRNVQCQVATPMELRAIHVLGRKEFGPDISSVPTMREWIKKYPRTFFVVRQTVVRATSRTLNIVGYFCIMPLTENAARRYLNGEIKASSFRHDDICVIEPCFSVYVGAIMAKGKVARGIAVAFLRSELETQWLKRPDVRIIARPLTDNGVRLTTDFGFLTTDGALPSKGKLCQVLSSDLLDAMPPSRRLVPERR